jgi:predicted aspartyl protease
MIRGQVNQRIEAVIPLLAIDSSNQIVPIDAAIDSGFNGELTLASTHLARLGLVRAGLDVVQLADGTMLQQLVYAARLNWDGAIRNVNVILIESNPLVGLKLLGGYRLTIDIIVGGPVTIEPTP